MLTSGNSARKPCCQSSSSSLLSPPSLPTTLPSSSLSCPPPLCPPPCPQDPTLLLPAASSALKNRAKRELLASGVSSSTSSGSEPDRKSSKPPIMDHGSKSPSSTALEPVAYGTGRDAAPPPTSAPPPTAPLPATESTANSALGPVTRGGSPNGCGTRENESPTAVGDCALTADDCRSESAKAMAPLSCDGAACAGSTDERQLLTGFGNCTAPTSTVPFARSGIAMQPPAASAKAPHPTAGPDGPAVPQHCRERAAEASDGTVGDTGDGANAGTRARARADAGAGPEESTRDVSSALEWSVSSGSRENSSSSLSCAYLVGVPNEAFSVRPSSTTPSTARIVCSASSRLA
mmetsp:Transcript_23415/g.47619  ORF Transcript_23415/g.47619 Transcript_23415/m.47619 type:complete len:349 (-) Transcript_23415:218-1264(-)